MGEPLPGDIPDPTHLKTTNALLEGEQVGVKGDWLTYDEGTDFWQLAAVTAPRLIPNTEAIQLQEDILTTNIADGVVNAAAFGNGSWVYALMAGDCLPNKPVILVVFDSGSSVFKYGFTNSLTVEGDISVATLIATVVTDDPHGYKVGDKVTIVSASLDETGVPVTIATIVDPTTFTFVTTSSDFGSETATSNFDAILNGGSAKYIKRSGDTFAQKGVLNEIGVFAMTGLGL